MCIVGGVSLPIWFEASHDRLRRSVAKRGIDHFVRPEDLGDYQGNVILVRPDAVIDAPALDALIKAEGAVLLSTGASPSIPVAAHAPVGLAAAASHALLAEDRTDFPQGMRRVTSEELASAYWKSLRKREIPYAMVLSRENIRSIEWRMFTGTYKGATDFVTKWLWPRPAFYVTLLCARLRITPNMVTSLSLVFVCAAFYWFLNGGWLLGLIAAWLMTFLDTVDGKLARITLASSKFGNVFDHSIDLVHPPFWYVAWGMGVMGGAHAMTSDELAVALTVIVGGYVLQRIIEGLSIVIFKIEIHVWRPIDTFFRQITARRNPNLVLLTIAAPDVDLNLEYLDRPGSSALLVRGLGDGCHGRRACDDERRACCRADGNRRGIRSTKDHRRAVDRDIQD